MKKMNTTTKQLLKATIIACIAVVTITLLVCNPKHSNNDMAQSIMSGLRPAVVGLIAAAALLLMNSENFSAPSINPWYFGISLYIFAATLIGTMALKINPIRMICWAAFAGLMLLY